MSRDFILEFENEIECEKYFTKIKNIKTTSNENLFGDYQKMKNKLFVSLTYSDEIIEQKIENQNIKINLRDYVDFVAIKNGMHNEKGYVYSNFTKLPDKTEVHKINEIILNYYDNKTSI